MYPGVKQYNPNANMKCFGGTNNQITRKQKVIIFDWIEIWDPVRLRDDNDNNDGGGEWQANKNFNKPQTL